MLLLVGIVLAVPIAWMALETLLRIYLGWPLPTDFYGSIPRDQVLERQARHGLKVATGTGWAHLGWIAHPERERYRIEARTGDTWNEIGRARYGSYLVRTAGTYRVWAVPRDGSAESLLGSAETIPQPGTAPLHVPRIDGPWREVFRPSVTGNYINDHTVYRDGQGRWRVVGITAPGTGDYTRETRFAAGVSDDFPPRQGMREVDAVADVGETAWAPHAVTEDGRYLLFWSPHRLHRMHSSDGVTWEGHRIIMEKPFHRFFRDPMVFRVAEGQWLLYTTARGRFFSSVDVYQSFDLEGWQYIGAALDSGPGSERNSAFASMESPFVVQREGRYYLSLTYNNDTFFWSALLLAARRWPDRETYNDTMVFHAGNPYHFGTYRGRKGSPSLLTRLRAHAPEFVRHPETGAWYVTTAGWPWVSTLTTGEVAAAPLRWDPAPAPAEPLRPSGARTA